MSIATIWHKIRRFRWGFAVLAAGLVVVFGYGPSWGHGTRPLYESPAILVSDHIDASRTEGYFHFISKKDKKWESLSPEEKKQLRKIRRRMKRLNKMSPRERKTYRQLHEKWRHLPPGERKQLQKELNNWENLSPREQEAIRRKFMK